MPVAVSSWSPSGGTLLTCSDEFQKPGADETTRFQLLGCRGSLWRLRRGRRGLMQRSVSTEDCSNMRLIEPPVAARRPAGFVKPSLLQKAFDRVGMHPHKSPKLPRRVQPRLASAAFRTVMICLSVVSLDHRSAPFLLGPPRRRRSAAGASRSSAASPRRWRSA